MTNHANEDVRCETRDPQPEGINHTKMAWITNRWGATWESIYGILFPGAPVPDPCKPLG